MLAPSEYISLPSDAPPILLVVVDTEEEFDWSGSFDRNATSTEAIRQVGRFQEVCDECGVRPTYVIDYPIATGPWGARHLGPIVEDGRAVVGAHLHPWVNPPFSEEVNARNSYAGNLPPDVEREKIRSLANAIEKSFGSRPTSYKAGRYGVGANTEGILEQEGFEVDLSVNPGGDYRRDGGPAFPGIRPDPWWFGVSRPMLEIPLTSAHVGWLHRAGELLTAIARTRWGEALRMEAILSKSRAMERLYLSPEYLDTAHHVRLVRALLERGTRIFTFSFHSPSLLPGCTPYVRSSDDLETLLARCRAFFTYFLGELGGRSATPEEVRDLLHREHPPTRAFRGPSPDA